MHEPFAITVAAYVNIVPVNLSRDETHSEENGSFVESTDHRYATV